MILYINNEPHHFSNTQQTLASVLKVFLTDSASGVAVAVNDVVVSKMQWEKFTVNSTDKITLIRAAAGG